MRPICLLTAVMVLGLACTGTGRNEPARAASKEEANATSAAAALPPASETDLQVGGGPRLELSRRGPSRAPGTEPGPALVDGQAPETEPGPALVDGQAPGTDPGPALVDGQAPGTDPRPALVDGRAPEGEVSVREPTTVPVQAVAPTRITAAWREVTRPGEAVVFEPVMRGVLGKSVHGYHDVDGGGALVLRPELVLLPEGASSVSAAMRGDFSELWISTTIAGTPVVFGTAAELQSSIPGPGPSAP